MNFIILGISLLTVMTGLLFQRPTLTEAYPQIKVEYRNLSSMSGSIDIRQNNK